MSDRDDPLAATVLGAPPSSASLEVAPRRVVVAGRYEILGLLGGGAMGTVYRARDRELDEVVALKVLKKELAGAPGMLSRFRREVKLARRVTHRNVARTFDIGEDGGDRFLTMELVDGESLASRLERAGRLSLREVVAIVKDICAGLSAAHEAGVLHRDLKPDNVIVANDGRAVITDFGIARAAMEGEVRTAIGSFVGTPLYMAPEQVEGREELDARADLYALGAMAFELLTGRPAWERDSIMAIAAARLLSPAPDPRAIVGDLPEAAALLVQRLMARRREDRPSSAAEVAAAFDALEVVSVAKVAAASVVRPVCKKRVAVLPLVTSGSEDETYLAYGVAEELTELLSTMEGIAVRPRSARSMIEGGSREPREMGRRLDVDVVVDGSVRRTGDRIRVTLHLVTVEDGFELWAQTLEQPVSDALAIADDAARAIAEALTAKLVLPSRAPAVDAQAEDLLLKGKYFLHRGFGPNRDEAVDVLRRAYALAPSDARIAGNLALALARLYRLTGEREQVEEEAKTIAIRALELDATRAEARVALGTLHLARGDGEKAAVELSGALRVARSSVEALDAMGRLLLEAGEIEEGTRLVESALAREEVLMARHTLARMHALLGEWDRVEETFGDASLDAGAALPMLLLLMRLINWAPSDRWRDALLERAEGLPIPADRKEQLRHLAAIARGDAPRDEMNPLLELVMAGLPGLARRGIAFRAQLRAEVFGGVGRRAEALEALKASDEAKLFDIVWLDRCPTLASLRDEPAFAEVRGHVAARASSIVAAYDRARVSIRGRARRPA